MCLQLLFLIDLEIIMELKFRCFCLYNKEMLYSDRHYPNLEAYFGDQSSETSDYMQFTGLKDKNGVEIYAGDIVNHNGIGVGHIDYNDKHAAYKIVFKGTTRKWLIDMIEREIREIEVIGNIYENPELIKPL